eukprot:TRINITY_DN3594_c0_g1_i1.p1 TRINITY_DN3594_c0_g1~~TRINITY_DN3594_c0_g1_i1.p1  ORF type:complete len:299 (-),score=39.98 TRINITY_DN3594_c0_g1_i1:245-1141(-)
MRNALGIMFLASLCCTLLVWRYVAPRSQNETTLAAAPKVRDTGSRTVGVETQRYLETLNPVQRQFATLAFDEVRQLVSFWTLVPKERMRFVYDYIGLLNNKGIKGDIVECGVWKGGMTMAMIFANMQHNLERKFFLLDTFEGLPKPDSAEDGPEEKHIWAEVHAGNTEIQPDRRAEQGKWNYGPEDVVRNNMLYTQYPKDNIHFIRGKVEDTLRNSTHVLPDRIAVLRLDTDWYSSTLVELEVLYDRLVPGGLLFVDDYCAWAGSRKATEFFFTHRGMQEELRKKQNQEPCFHLVKAN